MPAMRWSEAGDGALLSASAKHPDGFMAFYQRYEPAVIGYLLRRTRNRELAVDLASEDVRRRNGQLLLARRSEAARVRLRRQDCP